MKIALNSKPILASILEFILKAISSSGKLISIYDTFKYGISLPLLTFYWENWIVQFNEVLETLISEYPLAVRKLKLNLNFLDWITVVKFLIWIVIEFWIGSKEY